MDDLERLKRYVICCAFPEGGFIVSVDSYEESEAMELGFDHLRHYEQHNPDTIVMLLETYPAGHLIG